jgi:hypothetical protein
MTRETTQTEREGDEKRVLTAWGQEDARKGEDRAGWGMAGSNHLSLMGDLWHPSIFTTMYTQLYTDALTILYR